MLNQDRWEWERSSGYSGWRCQVCGVWVYNDTPMVCDCNKATDKICQDLKAWSDQSLYELIAIDISHKLCSFGPNFSDLMEKAGVENERMYEFFVVEIINLCKDEIVARWMKTVGQKDWFLYKYMNR